MFTYVFDKNRRRNEKQWGQFTTNYMSMKNIFLFMKNTRILFKLPCLPHVKYRNLETYKQVNKSIHEEMYR